MALFFVLLIGAEFYRHFSLVSVSNTSFTPEKSKAEQIPASKELSREEINSNLIESMQSFVQNDLLCKALENLPGENYSRLLQVFTNLHLLSPEWEELSTENNPLSGKPPRAPKSEIARFFSALLLSNQLEGINTPKPNYPRAEKILKNLAQEFPENAAYPFFLLPIQEMLGAPEVELVALAKEASQATIFDTHFASFARAVQEASWFNATSNFLAQIILTSLPIPSTPNANLSFMKLARSHQLLPEIHAMALLLMKQGLESKESHLAWGYVPIEYSVGRSNLAKGYPPIDPNSFPKYSDLPAEKSQQLRVAESRDSPILEMRGCEDEMKFRDWFSDAKSNR